MPDERFITQTILASSEEGAEKGNCLAACVASILALPLADVPNFVNAEEFPENFYAWLECRGLGYAWMLVKNADGGAISPELLPDVVKSIGTVGFHLIYGTSPRGFLHSCVGYAGKVVHDPHPSRAGLVDAHAIGFIMPLDPTRGGLLAN